MITYGIPLLTVLVAAALVWLAMARARRDAPRIFEQPAWQLVADADGLRVRSPTGDFRELDWDDVGAVRIRRAQVGSRSPEVDWVFESAWGGPPLIVPHVAAGVDALLRRAPAHLDGFVYDEAIALVSSSDLAEVEAWRRADLRRAADLSPGANDEAGPLDGPSAGAEASDVADAGGERGAGGR